MKLQKPIKQRLVLAIVIMLVIGLFSCATEKQAAQTQEAPHSAVKNTNKNASMYHTLAKAVTEQCPVAVDELTTLTAFSYNEEQNELTYTYLISVNAADINEQQLGLFQQTLKNMRREEVKNNQSIAQFRADAVVLTFVYNDKNGKELCSMTFKPGEY